MDRPNILLIHTDQQRWDTLGANGNDEIDTPNLDRLASEGVNFDQYFVQSPVCMPSRASYMTGRYPSQLGIFNNGVPLPEDTRTLPRLFESRAYTTGNVGKLHFQPHANRDHREPHPAYGFDHVQVSDTPGVYEDAYRAWIRQRAPDQLDKISVGLSSGAKTWQEMLENEDGIDHPHREGGSADFTPTPFPADDDLTHSAFVADQTMEFLEAHQDERFLCVAGFFAPHHPFVVPQRFLDRYDPDDLSLPEFPDSIDGREDTPYSDKRLRQARHGYYAMVSGVDYYVGQILDRLEDLGLRENTLVVFTSDHGEYLGEHCKYGKGFPGEDCVSRVPLIVRWPAGLKSTGRTVSDIVEAVDLVPTLLECTGIQVPPDLDGESFAPALRDEPFEGRDSALLAGGARELEGHSLRTDEFRYVLETTGEEALYDLDREHGEYVDVSADPEYEDDLARLRYRLLNRLQDIQTQLPQTWVY